MIIVAAFVIGPYLWWPLLLVAAFFFAAMTLDPNGIGRYHMEA